MHVLCNGNKFSYLNRHTVQWSLHCLWKSEYYFRFIIKRDILWKKFVYFITVIVKGKEFSSIFCDYYVCIIYFIVFNYDFLIWSYNVNRIVRIAFILVLETTWLIRLNIIDCLLWVVVRAKRLKRILPVASKNKSLEHNHKNLAIRT